MDRFTEIRPSHPNVAAALRAVGTELGISPHTLREWVNAATDVDNVVVRRRGVGISAVLSLALQRVLNQGRRFTVRDATVEHQIAKLTRRVLEGAGRADVLVDAPGTFARSYGLRAVTLGPGGVVGRAPIGVVFGGSNYALQTKAASLLADATPLVHLQITDWPSGREQAPFLLGWQYRKHAGQPSARWVRSPLAAAVRRGHAPVVVSGHADPEGFGFLVEVMDRPWRAGFGFTVPDAKYEALRLDTDEFVDLLKHDPYLAAALRVHPESPILLKMNAYRSQLQLVADTLRRPVYGFNGLTHTFTLRELESTRPWAKPFTLSDGEFEKMRQTLGAAPAQLRNVAAANDWSVTAVSVAAEPNTHRVPDALLRCTPSPY